MSSFIILFALIISLSINIFINATETIQKPSKAAIWIVNKSDSNNQKDVSNIVQLSRSMKISDIKQYIDEKLATNKVDAVVLLKSSVSGDRLLNNKDIIKSIQSSSSAVLLPNVYPSVSTTDNRKLESIENAIMNVFSDSKSLHTIQEIQLQDLSKHLNTLKIDSKPDNKQPIKTFVTQIISKNEEHRNLLQNIHNNVENVLFIAIDEPVVITTRNGQIITEIDTEFKPMRKGEYSRLLETNGQVFPQNSKFYKPEGSEYSIYYASTYLYITPEIFTGLLTFIFMTFAAYIGEYYVCLLYYTST